MSSNNKRYMTFQGGRPGQVYMNDFNSEARDGDDEDPVVRATAAQMAKRKIVPMKGRRTAATAQIAGSVPIAPEYVPPSVGFSFGNDSSSGMVFGSNSTPKQYKGSDKSKPEDTGDFNALERRFFEQTKRDEWSKASNLPQQPTSEGTGEFGASSNSSSNMFGFAIPPQGANAPPVQPDTQAAFGQPSTDLSAQNAFGFMNQQPAVPFGAPRMPQPPQAPQGTFGFMNQPTTSFESPQVPQTSTPLVRPGPFSFAITPTSSFGSPSATQAPSASQGFGLVNQSATSFGTPQMPQTPQASQGTFGFMNQPTTSFGSPQVQQTPSDSPAAFGFMNTPTTSFGSPQVQQTPQAPPNLFGSVNQPTTSSESPQIQQTPQAPSNLFGFMNQPTTSSEPPQVQQTPSASPAPFGFMNTPTTSFGSPQVQQTPQAPPTAFGAFGQLNTPSFESPQTSQSVFGQKSPAFQPFTQPPEVSTSPEAMATTESTTAPESGMPPEHMAAAENAAAPEAVVASEPTTATAPATSTPQVSSTEPTAAETATAPVPSLPRVMAPTTQLPSSFSSAPIPTNIDETNKQLVDVATQILLLNESFKAKINSAPANSDWTALSEWHVKQSAQLRDRLKELKKSRAASLGITGKESGLSQKRKGDADEDSEESMATPSKKPRVASNILGDALKNPAEPESTTPPGSPFSSHKRPQRTPAPQKASGGASAPKSSTVQASPFNFTPPAQTSSGSDATTIPAAKAPPFTFTPSAQKSSGADATAMPAAKASPFPAFTPSAKPEADKSVSSPFLQMSKAADGGDPAKASPFSAFTPSAKLDTENSVSSPFLQTSKGADASGPAKASTFSSFTPAKFGAEKSASSPFLQASKGADASQSGSAKASPFSAFTPSNAGTENAASSPFLQASKGAAASTSSSAKASPFPAFTPSATADAKKSALEPEPSQTPSNFMAQFAKSAKTAEQLAAEAKKKAKEADYDSEEEDEETWSKRYDEELAEKKAAQKSESVPSFTFKPASGSTTPQPFGSRNGSPAVSVFDAPQANTPSASNIFGGSTTPQLLGSRSGSPAVSVFDAPHSNTAPSNNIFGHLSSGPSSNNQGSQSDDDDDAEDSTAQQTPRTFSKKRSSAEASDDEDLESTMRASKKSKVPSLMSRMTPNDGPETPSLMSRMTKDDSPKDETDQPTPVAQPSFRAFQSFDFGAAAAKSSFGQSFLSAASKSVSGDNTFKPTDPIKFASAPGLAASALSTRAPTPVSEQESAQESGQDDNAEEASINSNNFDLSMLTESEKENHDILFEHPCVGKRQIADPDNPGKKKWDTFSTGRVYVLKERTSGKSLVRLREVSGKVAVNYYLMPTIKASVTGRTRRMAIAPYPHEAGKPDIYLFTFKEDNVAETFADVFNQNLPA